MSKYTDRIDMRFAYTPASKTDVRKTIAKELRRIAAEKTAREAAEAEQVVKVRKIKEAKA